MTEMTAIRKEEMNCKLNKAVDLAEKKLTAKYTKKAKYTYRKQVRNAIESGALELRPEEDFVGGQYFSGKCDVYDSIMTYFRINVHDFEVKVDKTALKAELQKIKDARDDIKKVYDVKSYEDIAEMVKAFEKRVKSL